MARAHLLHIRFAVIGATASLLAASAHAGAPGHDDASNAFQVAPPVTQIVEVRDLSPAEIRNAVSIRMDELAAQGIEVDRAAVDGIGLESYEDRLAQAETP